MVVYLRYNQAPLNNDGQKDKEQRDKETTVMFWGLWFVVSCLILNVFTPCFLSFLWFMRIKIIAYYCVCIWVQSHVLCNTTLLITFAVKPVAWYDYTSEQWFDFIPPKKVKTVRPWYNRKRTSIMNSWKGHYKDITFDEDMFTLHALCGDKMCVNSC